LIHYLNFFPPAIFLFLLFQYAAWLHLEFFLILLLSWLILFLALYKHLQDHAYKNLLMIIQHLFLLIICHQHFFNNLHCLSHFFCFLLGQVTEWILLENLIQIFLLNQRQDQSK
jgi:hypothetical protein